MSTHIEEQGDTQSIVIRLGDGYLFVEPAFPDSLTKKLRYWRRSLEWDEGAMRRVAQGRYEELYSIRSWIDDRTQQYRRQLTTMPGFAFRVKQALSEAGWKYKLVDERTPLPRPDYARALKGLREYQMECAYTAIASGGGVVACPTGWGKTHIIRAIVDAYAPGDLKARGTPLTVVAAPDKEIAAKNFRDLKGLLPHREVGLVMSGHTNFSDDVQVITLDSLHRLTADEVGIAIVDEAHTAASDRRSDAIIALRKAARWGVSATPTGRFDGGDLVTEGLFGPIVYTRSYADGVKDGALVPIVVYWIECEEPAVGIDKYSAYSTRVGRYRHGVWRNSRQNETIGKLMRSIPPNMQTLCIVQYLEQMNGILPLCGGRTTSAHAETDANRLTRYPNLRAISPKERRDIYKKMENSEIASAISTHIYKQGVNFPRLEIAINAGGGGSDIVARQIPGRESRKIEGKERSFLVDFWHPWDRIKTRNERWVAGPVHADDMAREKAYSCLGFEQVWVSDLSQLPFMKSVEVS